jgi:ECF transporter S component (folate family)
MQKSMLSTKMLTRVASLIALSVVLKTYLSLTDGYNWRFSLFGIPLVIIGLMTRPHVAILSGLVVDIIYVMLSPFAWSVNLMTFEAVSFALIPSLMVVFYQRKDLISPKHLVYAVVLANLIGFIFNTSQLAIWANGFGPIIPFIPIRLMFMGTNAIIGAGLIEVLYKRLNENELIEVQ